MERMKDMVKIVADSTSDLPQSIIDEYDITVLPLTVRIGEETFLDGIEITSEEMITKFDNNDKLPATSLVSPMAFKEVFQRLSSNGDEVLTITLSSKLSGTYNSARIAKEELSDKKIEIIDSKNVTLSYGLMVIEAAKMAKDGFSLSEIKARINEMIPKTDILVVVDTLEYLHKGGRINGVQYALGNLLKMKILLEMNTNGEIIVKDKVRGLKKTMKYLKKYILSNRNNIENTLVGINHLNNPEAAEELKTYIVENCNPKDVIITNIGCTVAVYVGPGSFGLYFEK